MLKLLNVTDVYGMQVFTDAGDYFGDIEEAYLVSNKVSGWRIKATRNSFLTKILGGAKGVVVPHNMVKSIGDVMLISRAAIPAYEEEDSSAVESN